MIVQETGLKHSSRVGYQRGAAALRGSLVAAAALATSACANQSLDGGQPRFASPMMLINSQAQAAEAPVLDAPSLNAASPNITHKSLAAKVLASRALEIVTGLKPDPARLSEHD